MFSLRIVTTDHYMSPPVPELDVKYSDLRGSEVKRVPVVRVFGSTPAGQKTCMHIHGVFPYLYVPYDGTAPWDRYLRQFAASLDKAVNVAQGQGQSNQQHVFKISIVSGTSMYGYHNKDQQFLKIYMYNPQIIRKAADLLLGGAVMNKPFQPHESHIPYTLQLFIDYNLYGMNLINVAAVKFRRKLNNENERLKYRHREVLCSQGSDKGIGSDPKTPGSVASLLNRSSSLTPAVRYWDYENIPSEMFLDDDIERQSVCELEVDVVAADILNRLEVNANVGANPGLAALWEDERQRRRERGEPVDNIAPLASQEREDIETADSEQILRERLQQIIKDLQPYMDSQSDSEMETSEDELIPATQASQLDLHLSQDDIGGSQDTLMFDLDNSGEDEVMVDEASVRQVVSRSQSFCDVKPASQKVSTQDRSLVDILAALAEDTEDGLSQQAVVEAVALEEHDSMLAQTSKPRDIEIDKLEEDEMIEMSQRIWDGDERETDPDGDKGHNLEGIDDTWVESQTVDNQTIDVKHDAGDSDTDKDVIPQFDGAGDEKSPRREVKDMVTKRLGMRGPSYNMAHRDMGMMQDHSSHYGQYGPSMGNYGGYQANQSPLSMSQVPHRPYSTMPSQQNQNWGGPMYPQHPHGSPMNHSQRDISMLQSSQSRMHFQPGPMHHPSMRMQQSSGSMYHPGNMNQSPMHQIQQGMGMNHSQGNMQISPPTMNTYGDQQMSMYPGGDHPGYSRHGQGMKSMDIQRPNIHQYGNKIVTSPTSGPSGFMTGYPNTVPYSSKQQYMSMEHSGQPRHQPTQLYGQQNQSLQQPQSMSSQMHHSQLSTSSQQPFLGSNLSLTQMTNQMPDTDFDTFCGIGQQDVLDQESGNMNMSTLMSTQQQKTSYDSLMTTQSFGSQHQTATYSSTMQQGSATSLSPRSTNQSPASDMTRLSQPTSYILKRPQSKGSFSGESTPLKGSSPGSFGLGEMDIYNSLDQHGLNKSPGMSGSGFVPNVTPASSVNTYHINKPVSQTKAETSTYSSSFAHRVGNTSSLRPSDMGMHSDLLRPDANKEGASFTSSTNLESPNSASNLFSQKKLCYEQISPPSTPSLEKSQMPSKQLTSSPVASQHKADSQLSPLQKLLLEPTMDRGGMKPSVLQRSQSRNSVSSVSSDKGSQNIIASQKSPSISSPAAKSRPESLSDSRLYNLLANEGDNKNKPSDRLPKVSSSNKLNDSQQDLFSESLLSPVSSGNLQDTTSANDSFVSLFSDSFDGSETNSQTQKGNMQVGNQTGVSVSFGDKLRTDKVGEGSKTDSLSTLESFVGSVTSDTDYGINFSKGSGGLQRENSMMSGISDQSFLSQLSNNDLSDLGTFTGQFPAFQNAQQIQSHSTTSYNMSSWPEHQGYQRKSSPKRLDGGPPRKRGRPPKSSLSTPGMSVIPAIPGEKKRRGRPRKNSVSVGAPQQNATSPSHSIQNQFSQFQDSGGYLGVNIRQQFQQGSMQQQIPQQEQFQSNQTFYGHQQMQPQENIMSQSSSNQNFSSGFSMQYQSFQTMNQQDGNFNQFFNSDGPIQQQSFMELQQNQQSQQTYNQNFMAESYLQQTQEFKQDTISNQGSFLSQSNSNMSTIDASQLFHEEPLQEPLHLDSFDEAPKPSEIAEKNSNELNQDQDFQLTTLQSMKHPNTLVQNLAAHYLPGKSSLSELWKSPPVRHLPSPAYTFKFQVPTPHHKHSQIDESGTDFTPLVVRMHPKDARKYSLLKIGREIIKLKRISTEKIERIKNQIKEGIVVESIPAPLRKVTRENSVSNSSIISDLFSCDSPNQGDVIESALVDSAIQSSFQEKSAENSITSCVAEPNLSIKTCNSFKQVNDIDSNELNSTGKCFNPIKRQRRPSDIRERRRNMFKNKNIANIPHLKKYRQGFSYFGKGNIGRGGSVKVRQSHPVLGPEFEDDSSIVLKDVSLNDGVLTPIKSRTPIAGRSPAHCTGQNACDLENAEKEELETKLKSLYDLELNQNPNPEMFNDSEMFVGEDEENSEDEDSEVSAADDVDGNSRQDFDQSPTTNFVEDITDNKENVNTDSIHHQPNDLKASSKLDEGAIITKLDEVALITNEESVPGKEYSKSIIPKSVFDNIEKNKDLKNNVVSTETDEKLSEERQRLKEEPTNYISVRGNETSLASKDCDGNKNSKAVKEFEKSSGTVFYGKFKTHFKEKFAQLQNEIQEANEKDVTLLVNSDETDMEKPFVSRSRSSSCDSKEAASLCGSRRSSAALSVESGLLSSESSSVKSYKQSVDNKKKCKRKTKKSNSVSSGSRKSSRSSSVDKEIAKKTGKNFKRKPYNVDSDSDGIPGVDYIVIGKFKGYKEMKVKVDKMDIDSDTEVVNVRDYNTKNSADKNGIVCNKDYMHTTGFSAEFEKFLANQSQMPSGCIRTSSCDSQGSANIKLNNDLVKSNAENNKISETEKEKHSKESGLSSPIAEKNAVYIKDTEDGICKKLPVTSKNEDGSSKNGSEKIHEIEAEESNLNKQDILVEDRLNPSQENESVVSNHLGVNQNYTEQKNVEVHDYGIVPDHTDEESHCSNIRNRNSSTNIKEEPLDLKADESNGKDRGGECKFDSLCSCVDACNCSVKVCNSALISTTGSKHSSSSSEDESGIDNMACKKSVKSNMVRQVDRKRKKRASHRLANAFCGSKARKRKPQKRRPSKWMSTLNVLHDATMEKLTANKVYGGEMVTDKVLVTANSNPESVLDKQSVVNVVPPDFEVYCDRAIDYEDDYSDTLFRLAYYSPPSSDNGNYSSPQPLSPEEIKQMVSDSENKPEVLIEHREKKMTLADVMKSVRQSDEEPKENSKRSKIENLDSDISIDNEVGYQSPSKTAIAHETPLTLKDIKSCLEQDELAKKIDLSSPPDLGPPVIPKYVSDNESSDDHNAPPNLTPNRQLSNDSTRSDVECTATRHNDVAKASFHESFDERLKNIPPFLTPCRSPRIPLSPRGSPRVLPIAELKSEISGYFSVGSDVECEYKVKPGKSPGACSSTGSINVIHSEQFSDISEDEEADVPPTIQNQNTVHIDTDTSPVILTQNHNTLHRDTSHSAYQSEEMIVHSRILKEVKEFEEQHEHSDLNKNNIFDLLSSQNGKFIESKEFKSSKPKCNSKEQFVRNVELLMGKNHITKNSMDYTRENGVVDNYMASYCDLGVNSIDSMNHSLQSQKALHKSATHSSCDLRTGLFDSVGLGKEFWMDNKSSRTSNGYKSFNSVVEHADNPLGALIDMHKFHFSSTWNSFQSPQSFHSNNDRSDKLTKDKHSMDLFDSSSEKSNRLADQSSRHQLLYNRSLSESSKYDLSIVANRKLSDSIMKSVENMKDKGQIYQRSHSVESYTPSSPTDKGGKKPKSAKKPVEGTSENSTTNQKNSNSADNTGGLINKTDIKDNQGNNNNPKRRKLMESEKTCNIITPLLSPPSKESVQQTHSRLGLMSVQTTGAFYSNHRDMPSKPREGGGQVLKIPSALVKDLVQFSSNAYTTGIKGWRSLFCVNDNVFLSQSEPNTSVREQLDQQPQLKYALTGDIPVVICPFDAPPSKKQVLTWCKGRKLYKDLKNQALQKKGAENEKALKDSNNQKEDNGRDIVKNVYVTPTDKEGKNVVKEPKQGDKLRLNLFTGKREMYTDEGSNSSLQSECESFPKSQEGCIQEHADNSVRGSPKLDIQIQSPVTGLTKSETPTGSPQPGSLKTEDDNILHSTPLLRKQSTELFEPECTPITEDRKRQEPDNQDQFVTPKRIKSLRSRRSSASGRGLHQAFMNTQLKKQFVTPQSLQNEVSQIEGPSLKNSFGFKLSQQNFQTAKTLHEHLTVLSVEVHAESRGDLRPDPEVDAIQAIFYSIFNDVPPEKGTRFETGVFIWDAESANESAVDKSSLKEDKDKSTNTETSMKAGPSSKDYLKTLLQKSAIHNLNVVYFKTEMDMLQEFKKFITQWDPDILVGYEIQMSSWGFILQRASQLSYNLTQAISRVPSFKQSSHHSAERDEWGADHHSEIHIAGRIVLNLWRILRHEVTLNIYSFENVAFHVLHRRIPLYSFRSLTSWFKHRTHHHRWKVVDHYVTRVKAILDIMDKLDLVGRTSEFARVFGIEFYHVLSRGSQYRVESMMLRVAKPLNYIPVSPSVHQRARMKAPECIPLTLEPKSRFYTDPVIVLDFQSLYPSIMIAYNYCFSTCLGRLEWFQNITDGPIEFGCTSLNLTPSMIKNLEKDVTISPNGIVFCTQSVKQGVLPMMVEEILNTRLMVKKAMSNYKDDKTLSRLLNARQLGLKLIANVTYGYTGANFSGRMPCIEVGDSIVRKARETLERSIKLVEETPKWGAKVIYGDTDSMFLLLKGCSKDQAFKIGQDIAKTVTKMFPKPIKLKFEKVYLPCVLQTKKRYCGFMYETPDQKDPVFDAKGIETVRRDSCSAVSKMLERSIKILFTSKDVSQVKSYIQQQCKKIMDGTVSLQDYIFAKEYRGIPGYKPGACVPALEISKKLLRQDRRSEPRVGERVPYVIVYGSPGLPLIQLVRQPMEILQDHALRLNSVYYITKQILPPLDRFLSLLGVDVFSWYHDMPHSAGRVTTQFGVTAHNKKGTISQYFATSNCPLCDEMTKQPVCSKCMKNPQLVCVTLNEKIAEWERVSGHLDQICRSCSGSQDNSTGKACISLDCPILFRKSRANADMDKVIAFRTILEKLFKP